MFSRRIIISCWEITGEMPSIPVFSGLSLLAVSRLGCYYRVHKVYKVRKVHKVYKVYKVLDPAGALSTAANAAVKSCPKDTRDFTDFMDLMGFLTTLPSRILIPIWLARTGG